MPATTTTPVLNVRWMILRDLPAVLATEAASFAEPWTDSDFRRCLRRRNCIGMVAANRAGAVLGYVIYELHPHRLTLLSLAVRPDSRRLGIGRAMLDELARKARTHGRERVEVTVDEREMPALRFFRACGWVAVGLDRGVFGEGEDGVEMEMRVDGGEDDWRLAEALNGRR